LAASLSLALAGCGSEAQPDPVTGRVAQQPGAGKPADDSDITLFTMLGLAKRRSQFEVGPQTGATVSPVLWEAAQDALKFAGVTSEDPMTGLLVTNWYSPPAKPQERIRITVYILSRALRSDSLTVTIERQERAANGAWQDAPVAKDTVYGLENAILQRARQIHAERYRSMM
jgi:hypothetical protein